MTPPATPPSRRARGLVALAGLALAAVLVAPACGGDDSSSDTTAKKTTTTEKSKTTDSTRPEGTDTTTTVDAAAFEAAVNKATAALEKAKTNCDVLLAVNEVSNLGNVTGADQTRMAGEFYALLAKTMAATTSDSAEAEKLRKGAEAFEAYGKANDWSPDKMRLDSEGPDIPEADSLQQGVQSYMQDAMTACGSGAGGAGGSDTGAVPSTTTP